MFEVGINSFLINGRLHSIQDERIDWQNIANVKVKDRVSFVCIGDRYEIS